MPDLVGEDILDGLLFRYLVNAILHHATNLYLTSVTDTFSFQRTVSFLWRFDGGEWVVATWCGLRPLHSSPLLMNLRSGFLDAWRAVLNHAKQAQTDQPLPAFVSTEDLMTARTVLLYATTLRVNDLPCSGGSWRWTYLEAVEAGRQSLGNLSKQRLLREKNWLSFVQNEK